MFNELRFLSKHGKNRTVFKTKGGVKIVVPALPKKRTPRAAKELLKRHGITIAK